MFRLILRRRDILCGVRLLHTEFDQAINYQEIVQKLPVDDKTKFQLMHIIHEKEFEVKLAEVKTEADGRVKVAEIKAEADGRVKVAEIKGKLALVEAQLEASNKETNRQRLQLKMLQGQVTPRALMEDFQDRSVYDPDGKLTRKQTWEYVVENNPSFKECLANCALNPTQASTMAANLYRALSTRIHRSLPMSISDMEELVVNVPNLTPDDKKFLECIAAQYKYKMVFKVIKSNVPPKVQRRRIASKFWIPGGRAIKKEG